jgi:glycosyltransferase involved in cell wall biosynthesis
MATFLHITTVHSRTDTRIFVKQTQTLASNLPHKVVLMVADGKGHLEEEKGRVSIIDLGHFSSSRSGRVLLGFWRAFYAIRKVEPDIIHFHDPELIPLGLLLKVIGYRVIYDIHEDFPRALWYREYLPNGIKKPLGWIVEKAENFAAKRLSALVVATPAIGKRFQKLNSSTTVVNNYPLYREFTPHQPVPWITRDRSIAYVGWIALKRGIIQMIRAMEYLSQSYGARLELAGNFYPPELENLVVKEVGWARTNHHGFLDRQQLTSLMGRVQAGLVLFHPNQSHLQAQPNKLFEYMAAGIPVIASDFPLWRKLITRHQCGLLVDPLDPQAIAEAIEYVFTHPVEAQRMGERGKEAVEKFYNWEQEFEKLQKIYKELIG